MKSFRRVLIANRGEIAVRIARTLRDMQLEPVMVYSQADADSYHVGFGDIAIALGGYHSVESYLCIEKIISAAKQSGAQAIHPGYGFLAENAAFAQAVIDAGLVWIGPSPQCISQMGHKQSARALMQRHGVPVIPGSKEMVHNLAQAQAATQHIGYPVMLKAVAGGGGKGMRLVSEAGQLGPMLKLAQSEAQSAFGNAGMYIEKAIAQPRHIEVQILADEFGNVVALGERECSMQRRHQKIIEESPAPGLSDGLRSEMAKMACRAVQSLDYVGVGTIEFIVDANHQFYFLEMNTRLQVEHPITELRFNLDLVAAQLQVAMGERLDTLPLPQGAAMEVRLCAEAPAQQFMPCPGKIVLWQPPAGPHVRVDAGIASGSDITGFYDPMMAKIIAYGGHREQARQRLVRALRETVVLGLQTNLDFLLFLLESAPFVAGAYSTHSVAQILPLYLEHCAQQRTAQLALAVAVAAAYPVAHARAPTTAWHLREINL